MSELFWVIAPGTDRHCTWHRASAPRAVEAAAGWSCPAAAAAQSYGTESYLWSDRGIPETLWQRHVISPQLIHDVTTSVNFNKHMLSHIRLKQM